MNTMRSVVKRHPIVTFFVLAYALSWWPALLTPHGILPLGPLLAALIVLPFLGGWSAVVDFLRRIAQWRVGLPWYALVLLLPVAVTSMAVGLNLFLGARILSTNHMPSLADLPMTLVFILLIGLGEEPAWRGFALPGLMAGRTALAGSLLLGVLHVIWHLPLFGLEYDWQNGLPWVISVLSFAIVTAWMYNRTHGSLLLPLLMHVSVNIAGRYLFNPLFSGTDLTQLYWLWGGLWGTVALIVVAVVGPNLGRLPAAQSETIVQAVAVG
jgi:membrane protease YdiL (CAAX protease family)